MELEHIRNVKAIISKGYNKDGVFIHDLWMDIRNSNVDFTLSETFESLILILRFMLNEGIAELIGYDEKNKKVISWDGTGFDELTVLKDYLSKWDEKKVKQNPNFLFQFRYLSYQWKIPYPMDPKKIWIIKKARSIF